MLIGKVIKDVKNNAYFTGQWKKPWSEDVNEAEHYDEGTLAELWVRINRKKWEADVIRQDIYYEIITICQFPTEEK